MEQLGMALSSLGIFGLLIGIVFIIIKIIEIINICSLNGNFSDVRKRQDEIIGLLKDIRDSQYRQFNTQQMNKKKEKDEG